jgi:hypothetical protein
MGSGIMFSSGLIAGGSIAGILLALTQVIDGLSSKLDFSKSIVAMSESNLVAIGIFALVACILFIIGVRKSK